MKFLDKLSRRATELLTGSRYLPEGNGTHTEEAGGQAPKPEATSQPPPPPVAPGRYDGPWELDRTLLNFATFDRREREVKIPFRYEHAYESTFVTGGVGSGKTSGSGRAFARAFLRAGMGGLVLCVKADEAETWVRYAEQTGRGDDLILFNEQTRIGGQPVCFNFLDYELRTAQGNPAEAACGVLMELVGANNQASGGENKIWERAARRLMRCCLLACQLAGEEPTLEAIYAIATSTQEAKKRLDAARTRDERGELTDSQRADYRSVAGFFGPEWQGMAEETKGSIMMNMTSTCDPFSTGIMRDLFTGKTNVGPEDIFNGKIVVIDLPTLRYYEAGKAAQVLWKYCFQRAVLRRTPNNQTRPTFLYADECQAVVTDADGEFAKVARSHRCATVFLTQNRPNLLAVMNRERVDSMLGCFQNKIFHQNGDPQTNEWAADAIAKDFQTRASTNTSYNHSSANQGPGGGGGTSYQQNLEHQVLPVEFLKLAKGGASGIVTAILFQSGRVFDASGDSFATVGFQQEKR